ncbi:hypothetical protein, partial [Bifidobacterium breve]|uniref:hypothetical protein n=1 Tax=Bifidobacterium breve TaxID=1685 RepID=UPI001B7FB8B8
MLLEFASSLETDHLTGFSLPFATSHETVSRGAAENAVYPSHESKYEMANDRYIQQNGHSVVNSDTFTTESINHSIHFDHPATSVNPH